MGRRVVSSWPVVAFLATVLASVPAAALSVDLARGDFFGVLRDNVDVASPTTVSQPTTPPTTLPSGEVMPVGDVPGWHQVFADDFNTNVPVGAFSGCTDGGHGAISSTCSGLSSWPDVQAKWWAYPDGWPDTESRLTGGLQGGVNMPSKVLSIHDGVLDSYLHNDGTRNLVAAPLPKIPGGSGWNGGLLYGRYVMRFRAVDWLPGFYAAWLLWPDSNYYPHNGEIDFPEGPLNGPFCGFMHHEGSTTVTQQDSYCPGTTFDRWHTSVLEWLPNRATFYVDGVKLGESLDPAKIPNTALHMVLQSETNNGGQQPTPYEGGHVAVDWIAVYKPAPQ